MRRVVNANEVYWLPASVLNGVDLSVLAIRYIRPLEALATTSSRDLGL